MHDAGRIDHEVETTELAGDALEKLAHTFGFPHIVDSKEREIPTRRGIDLGCHPFEFVSPARDQGHPGPVRRQGDEPKPRRSPTKPRSPVRV